MPIVNGKHFAYNKEGYKKAALAQRMSIKKKEVSGDKKQIAMVLRANKA